MMKNSGLRVAVAIFFGLLFMGHTHLHAQDINTKIAAAIRTSNSRDLSNYFNNTLDLTLPGNEGTFSKAQAEMVMKDFFMKNPPISFTLNHQGGSADGSKFGIGTYKCAKHEFRTYFLLKPVSGGLLIYQLKFGGDEDE